MDPANRAGSGLSTRAKIRTDSGLLSRPVDT
ncbi:conserved hypothetical protein [Verticillium alfalfae VaMs.102]|uniref:Uncharacterized protein n=1 Tax=Verticillium alfalfae (strain VaMs.102 / ATCC MYA-4576 / FGSC 10136) TaxID=526221 RepID=C9SCW7_VERA1|nr:conserved hypothetical protein [Verticillium alfalfae VaMs.102]EEY16932.1 conserved hypothetical protein [Verticillium alfalfae VaMs.102]